MKPAAAISAVVIAVLVTVVIEETRIKKLQAEVTRLRELPTRSAPPEDEASPEAPPTVAEAPAETPEPTPEAAAPPSLPGHRQVPDDHPEPDDDRIKQLAQGVYAQLHLELGLNNREASYLEQILMDHAEEMRGLAGQWVAASAEERPLIEAGMDEVETETGEQVRSFLGNDEDFATFSGYRDRQPEREMLGQMLPILDQQGVVLEIEEEQALIEAMHKARKTAGGIDWNSPTVIKVIAAGNAIERFEAEWNQIGERLRSDLADVLEPGEVDAVLAARDQAKAARLESVKATAAAIEGTDP